MKNYNQMAENVFRRRDEYLKEKARKKPIIITLVSLSLCLVLTFSVGGGVWLKGYISGTYNSDIAQTESIPSFAPTSSTPSKTDKPSSNPDAESSTAKYSSTYSDFSSTYPYHDEYHFENESDYGDGDQNAFQYITSIDSLNYYTGKFVATKDKVLMSGNLKPPKPITLINDLGIKKVLPTSANKVYYPIKPDTVFTVKSAIYFQAEIKVENGFLASKLGVGTTDVVMTVNNIDTIITFKQGEKFYSCMINSGHNDYEGWYSVKFSSHKYIDGYNVVKAFDQSNATFEIYVDGDEVVKINCGYSSTDPYNDPLTADLLTVIPNTTYISENCSLSFTAARLETAVESYKHFTFEGS